MMGSRHSRILITQPGSPALVNAYQRVVDSCGDVAVEFRPFSTIKPVPISLFRTYKPIIQEHGALLFGSKVAIDHFFSLAASCNIKLPSSQKYFFSTEPLQRYLGKYTEIKKRKVFCGRKGLEDLFPTLHKHSGERFLFPCSDIPKPGLKQFFKEYNYHYTEILIQETALCDVSDLAPHQYSIIVFFNPIAVRAFAAHFPNYSFEETKIATFSLPVKREVEAHGWTSTIHVPRPGVSSMLVALEEYLSIKGRLVS